MRGGSCQTYTVILCAVIGIGGLVFATKLGIGMGPDSVVYIQSARNLLAGNGLCQTIVSGNGCLEPLVHYPPLFPLALAFIGIFGVDPAVGARWLNILLFGATIALTGLIVRRYAGRRSWAPIVASLTILSSIVVTRQHAIALSEPLYLLFSFLGMFLLARYIETGKPGMLYASGGAVALACLDRYAGGAVAVSSAAAILLLGRRSLTERIRDMLVFAVTCSLPSLIWLARNVHVSGSTANRHLGFHPFNTTKIKNALMHVTEWIWPFTAPEQVRWGILTGVIAAGLVLTLALIIRRRKKSDDAASRKDYFGILPSLLTIFIFVHILVLIFSIILLHHDVPFDDRMLSSAYIAGIMVVALMLHRLFECSGRKMKLKLALLPLLVVFLLAHFIHTAEWAENTRKEGIGYSSREWQESPIIARLGELDENTIIYCNGPDALYVLTGRITRMFPKKILPWTGGPNPEYPEQMEAMGKALRDDEAVLVYMNLIKWRWYLPAKRELKAALPLKLVARTRDGSIYSYNDEETPEDSSSR